MVEELLAVQSARQLSIEDLLATCSRWTAEAVGTARRWIDGGGIDEVLVGGGGVRNRAIMNHLSDVFSPAPVTTFDALGWDSKALEAVAFGILGYQTIMEQYGNVPAVTGATHPVVLGCIVPGGPGWLRRLNRHLSA